MAKRKTYLVDGGAGFVGSHLAESLAVSEHRVVILDDLSNGSLDNLTTFRSKVTFVKGDISWPLPRVRRLVSGYRFDGIFHLACFPRSLSLADPQRDLEVNGLGTLRMLQLAREHGCKLVFTSNSGILGNPRYLPMDERHPDNPSTPYDASKLVGEYYCRIYQRIHGVPVGIVRFAAVYGARQQVRPGWKPLLAEFVLKLSQGKAPTIHWDGRQTRDFVYVKDAVQGVVKAMNGTTDDGYYLISTNTEVSVNQLYATVQKVLGTHVAPKHGPAVPGDIRRMKLSYARAKRAFGYRPNFSLVQGVRAYVRWFTRERGR